MNVEKMRKHNRHGTEMARPEDIKVGDRINVEFVVTSIEPPYSGGSHNHIHARIPDGIEHPWQLGDQHIWTWGWTGANGKKIERLRP